MNKCLPFHQAESKYHIDKRTLKLLRLSLVGFEKYVSVKQLAVHENLSFIDVNSEDLNSMKESLTYPAKIDLDLWKTYLGSVSKLANDIGEECAIDVSFLLNCLKSYRDNTL